MLYGDAGNVRGFVDWVPAATIMRLMTAIVD